HSTRPELTCRFQWREGSIAFWDNRCCQHLALNDYHGHRRLMHRVQVKGTRPA
ncbi:MAG: TauD/TfdA family dioxygenase, partial [Alphaproteobacteria bacterium]|nr:TauD/TfdA family dioxygenase [Alphaproteobacteria bacterium]